MGFIKSIKRFDANFEVKLSTYAVPYILGEIKRFIRDDGPVKVSRSIKETNIKICELQKEYLNKNGKEIRSDDKGFLVTEILYKGKKVKIVTGHMLPFHSLGSDSKNYGYLYEEMYSKVKTEYINRQAR